MEGGVNRISIVEDLRCLTKITDQKLNLIISERRMAICRSGTPVMIVNACVEVLPKLAG